jgi:hypothetical protein
LNNIQKSPYDSGEAEIEAIANGTREFSLCKIASDKDSASHELAGVGFIT